MRVILFNCEKDKEYNQFDFTILHIAIWSIKFSRGLFCYSRDNKEIVIDFLFFRFKNNGMTWKK